MEALRFEQLRVEAEFLAGKDCVQQRFTAVSLTPQPGSFHTSSCFNLQVRPMFYDFEQLRTYAHDATGKFVPLRRLSRGGDCVRWITGPSMNDLGDHVPCAVLAVLSRDGSSANLLTDFSQPQEDVVQARTDFTAYPSDVVPDVRQMGTGVPLEFKGRPLTVQGGEFQPAQFPYGVPCLVRSDDLAEFGRDGPAPDVLTEKQAVQEWRFGAKEISSHVRHHRTVPPVVLSCLRRKVRSPLVSIFRRCSPCPPDMPRTLSHGQKPKSSPFLRHDS